MKQAIILLTLLLIGCSPEVIEMKCENNTIINNTIEYRNNTIIEIVNQTCDQTAKELELIRRLKFLEKQQNEFIINETFCMPHNITEEKLKICEDKNDMYGRDIEELEDEIEDCEKEICKWNSSWC